MPPLAGEKDSKIRLQLRRTIAQPALKPTQPRQQGQGLAGLGMRAGQARRGGITWVWDRGATTADRFGRENPPFKLQTPLRRVLFHPMFPKQPVHSLARDGQGDV